MALLAVRSNSPVPPSLEWVTAMTVTGRLVSVAATLEGVRTEGVRSKTLKTAGIMLKA